MGRSPVMSAICDRVTSRSRTISGQSAPRGVMGGAMVTSIRPRLGSVRPPPRIARVPTIATGTIGFPLSTAALNAPSRKGRRPGVFAKPPSGKTSKVAPERSASTTVRASSRLRDTSARSTVSNEEGLAFTVASEHYVSGEIEHQREEIAARQRRFRGGGPLVLPDRATVILVDDGVATGSTVIAAIRALRPSRDSNASSSPFPSHRPTRPPVLRRRVDELVVLATPEPFGAVGAFYDEFPQVSDDEVTALLTRAAASAA